MKYIFITGGVVSSLGKGVAMSALASLLQLRGYKTRLKKMDPYLNIDPGTMSPYEHGEVFITEDGAETDLDLGHYERFTGNYCSKSDSTSAGKLYQNVISKERKGDYLGQTIQIIPHLTNEIKDYILKDTNNEDFLLCEIGGTVGDIESKPFLEAIRQFSREHGMDNVLFIHLTLVPYINSSKELKTKPTQHSVIELQASGIQPSIILCRTSYDLDDKIKNKIALFCNVEKEDVISANDTDFIYNVPKLYHKEGLDSRVLNYFKLKNDPIDLSKWENLYSKYKNPKHSLNIGFIGKYTELSDSYKSLTEALNHSALVLDIKLNIEFIDSEDLEKEDYDFNKLSSFNGILIPGGFGIRGAEGKIKAIEYARLHKLPFLGICFGMQLAVIEFARNVLNIKNASTTEFGKDCIPLVALITEFKKENELHKITEEGNKGGTMRLGSFSSKILPDTLAYKIYKKNEISERHRHRYEVNINYKTKLEESGMVVSGISEDGKLTEIIEIKDHPFFIGVQYHPEFKSNLFEGHPLFKAYLETILKNK